jgi:hypothetical protein
MPFSQFAFLAIRHGRQTDPGNLDPAGALRLAGDLLDVLAGGSTRSYRPASDPVTQNMRRRQFRGRAPADQRRQRGASFADDAQRERVLAMVLDGIEAQT